MAWYYYEHRNPINGNWSPAVLNSNPKETLNPVFQDSIRQIVLLPEHLWIYLDRGHLRLDDLKVQFGTLPPVGKEEVVSLLRSLKTRWGDAAAEFVSRRLSLISDD